MGYFGEVYLRLYSCATSFHSWVFWIFLFVILGVITGEVQYSDNKYKKRILYAYMVSLIGSFVLRLLLWIFLPSPEMLGLTK